MHGRVDEKLDNNMGWSFKTGITRPPNSCDSRHGSYKSQLVCPQSHVCLVPY